MSEVTSKLPVRVRFAPSPTGQLHVGNARTALFNWLFARRNGGTYILRVEDTDVERSEARYEDQLIADLKWLGLEWDEGPDKGGAFGPYRQSDRMQLYHDYAERLLQEGKAYLCFCAADELENDRKRAIAEHRSPIYSGKCRAIPAADALKRRDGGEAGAIRLHIPEHPIRFHDIVHGDVEFSNEVVSDPIIVRSTGTPVYNYVVVIDDAEMKITHVIRGDDHLSNTPKQVALYEALGWLVPEFAHLSTILAADKERLSKRHGATSIANFRDMGVLPEALVNYLALLGWAPTGGTRETFSLDDLVKEFSLERVTPSPAVFDMQKLYWLNRYYIAHSSPKRILQLAIPFLIKAGFLELGYFNEEVMEWLGTVVALFSPSVNKTEDLPQRTAPVAPEMDDSSLKWFSQVVSLIVPSVDKLEDLPQRAALIFHYDAQAAIAAPDNAEVLAAPKTPEVISAFCKRVLAEGPLTAERFKAIVNEVKTETGAKGKDLFHPIRTVVTGSHSGPEFDKLIPIIETGSTLNLPMHVLNVRERAIEFAAAQQAK